MVRFLISERSYPWAVEPAGLNGSIREPVLLLDTGHLRGRHVTSRAWQAGHGPQTNVSKGGKTGHSGASPTPARPWLRSGSFWGRTSRSTLPSSRSTSRRSEPGWGATPAIISQKELSLFSNHHPPHPFGTSPISAGGLTRPARRSCRRCRIPSHRSRPLHSDHHIR